MHLIVHRDEIRSRRLLARLGPGARLFNIGSVVLHVGSLATDLATANNCANPARHIEGYDGSHKRLQGFRAAAQNEMGDPAKAAAEVLDLVSIHFDQKKPILQFLPLGNDAVANSKAFLTRRTKEVADWKAWATDTNRDGL